MGESDQNYSNPKLAGRAGVLGFGTVFFPVPHPLPQWWWRNTQTRPEKWGYLSFPWELRDLYVEGMSDT